MSLKRVFGEINAVVSGNNNNNNNKDLFSQGIHVVFVFNELIDLLI